MMKSKQTFKSGAGRERGVGRFYYLFWLEGNYLKWKNRTETVGACSRMGLVLNWGLLDPLVEVSYRWFVCLFLNFSLGD